MGTKSLLIQERGLKYRGHSSYSNSNESLLIQERGLKYVRKGEGSTPIIVAPYTGAWIEIWVCLILKTREYVAPYTGAWIEILCERLMNEVIERRSLYRSVD